ncbi:MULTISPECIES: plastocyanin/azurin family copper-binding protein [Halobacterium]|uniref:Halocyanin HcpC n=6 Tax=Halobacterium salinarum TaxID=2242 RepID=A0A510N5G4_HALSA|nr:halocyanin [Halobacterium salinarum]QRY23303.1 halocyanin [Halobacterium sp. GSL-19]CAP13528.1 halocyanin HcpC [Halobacterium salinarum R1]DAC77963.1 TPA_inf: halocyanin HcpC [Halobacterium salinarum NRC-1]MCF2168818.1 halocyanin [Halobacterium salinarum]
MSRDTRLDRRTMLKSTGAAVTATLLAGCSGGGDTGDDESDSESGEEATGNEAGGGEEASQSGGNTIAVAPDGGFKFEPSELTVSVGDTVTWEFEESSHNVSAWPDMHDKISIPDGASGFGTMDKDGNQFAVVDAGETLEHTFETAGEYTYVCMPHVASGMIGTVVVEE